MNSMNAQEEEKLSHFESLTPDEQEKVLQFVGIANCDDMDLAVSYMKATNFNLNTSVQMFFDKGGAPLPPPGAPARQPRQMTGSNSQQQAPPPGFIASGQANNNQISGNIPSGMMNLQEEYRKFLERKQRQEEQYDPLGEMISGGWNRVKSGVSSLFFTPDGGDKFNAAFNKLGIPRGTLVLGRGKLKENLEEATKHKKPLLVLLTPPSISDEKTAGIIRNLLTDKPITDFITKKYLFLGLLNQPRDTPGVVIDSNVQLPAILIYRQNLLEEILVMDTISLGEEMNTPEEKKRILDRLTTVVNDFYFLWMEEDKVKKEVTRRMYQAPQPLFDPSALFGPDGMFADANFYGGGGGGGYRQQRTAEQEAQLIQDRLIREQQEEDYRMQVEHARQKEEETKRVQEQKRKEEEEAKQAKLLKAEEIQRKKESLPQEPEESELNVIFISFRLPSGSKLARRFLKSDKIQILYDYIEVTDNVEDISAYEIVLTRPFKLLDQKDAEIGSAFDPDSTSEALVIREKI